jgi:ribosomal protein S18 acetylase RimI-like enzyme
MSVEGKGLRGDHRPVPVRRAGAADAAEVARLLHDFNTEFGEPTPGVAFLTGHIRRLMVEREITVLLAGERPDGIALLRFRPSLWTAALDAHLEELYVAPPQRGRGIGRALLEAAMDAARERGAARMDLGTSEDDTAALALYESAGFTNRERAPDGPVMLYYERDL